MRCVPNIGEPPSYFGGSHVIEHQSPPTSGTKGASGASGMSADETIWPWPTIKKKKFSTVHNCFVTTYRQPWSWHWPCLRQPHSAGLSCSCRCPPALWLQSSGWSGRRVFQLGHDGPTQGSPMPNEHLFGQCQSSWTFSLYWRWRLKRLKLTLSPFIHTTLGAGSPLMGISKRSLFPATIVTVLSGKFKLSKCTLGGSADMISSKL